MHAHTQARTLIHSHPMTSYVRASQSVEEPGHLSLSLVVYLALRCQWCCLCVYMCVFQCVCVCVGKRNVLLTLRASRGLGARAQDYWSKDQRLYTLHTERERERSNLQACPRYQHSEHLLGRGLPSAVHSCQWEERRAAGSFDFHDLWIRRLAVQKYGWLTE